MGEGGFKGLIVGSIVIVLFAFLLLSFTFDLSNDYGVDTTDLEEGGLDFTALNSSLNTVNEDVQDRVEAFQKDNIFSIVAGIVVTGTWTMGKGLFTLVLGKGGLFDVVFIQTFRILGVPPIVTGIILTIIIMGGILALWRLLKVGD
jgi:hypothetical protein